ncbi:MAG: hypothetical protein GX424_04505 [Clostridiales bacterium]|nr:hypothetical protein [Clostridiales bacterium]
MRTNGVGTTLKIAIVGKFYQTRYNKINLKKKNKKPFFIAFTAFLFLFLSVGCQTRKNAIGSPPAPIKTVTQNSKENLATFEFQIPKDWVPSPQYNLSVVACPKDAAEKKFEAAEDSLPFMVGIGNYYDSGLALSEKDKQMYQDLFAGKTSAYEEHMKQSFANAASMLSSDSSGQTNVPSADVKYQHYDGTHGKITEVPYFYTYEGKKHHIIQCYREDIPSLVAGAFDESVDLSSGKIALWVADSLKVSETAK